MNHPETHFLEVGRLTAKLRAEVLDLPGRRLRISRIAESEQEGDLTLPPNCGGYGRIRHFRRATAPGWPQNPLPIDPASKALHLPQSDLLPAQAFQLAGCAFRCWYCFVPYNLLSANSHRSKWFSADELIDLYLAEADRPTVIDLTGGAPELVPEWIPWTMAALRDRGIASRVYLWSDDSLSTDYLWRYLSDSDLELIASYVNYGRVACFKGFDATSFSFNTCAAPELFDRQFELMKMLISLGFDCFAYVTMTSPSALGIDRAIARFVDRLQRLDEFLPLRTVPLCIQPFTPTIGRLDPPRRDALQNQLRAAEAWSRELESRYPASVLAQSISDVPRPGGSGG